MNKKMWRYEHWPWTLTEEEGVEVAEDVWHEIRDRRAGALAGEDTEMPKKNFPGNRADRRRLWPENEEESLSEAIEEQWEDIAAIVAFLWEEPASELECCLL